ncbi:antA/AntB antirepressor family protein [Melissococcus plutonius]|nr:antA/AntB antirepressor family protein [Melissococcus plutonius]
MNELIRTYDDEHGQFFVDGGVLYEFLEVSESYSSWLARMKEQHGFTDEDFIPTLRKNRFGDIVHEDKMTLDIAKDICMIQQTEKGKQAWQYFLQVEKLWSSPDVVMKRTIEFTNKQVKRVQLGNRLKIRGAVQGLFIGFIVGLAIGILGNLSYFGK